MSKTNTDNNNKWPLDTSENNEIKKTSEKKKKPKKKKKKKKFRVIKTILLILLILIIAGGLVAVKYALDIIDTVPEIDPTNILESLSQSSEIVDQNGTVIQQIQSANENREIVDYDQIPQYVKDAFVATEDRRFYEHPGIDIRRIAGALVSNLKSGDLTGQGGSTITQQLVKNLYLYNDKALERKIKEMYLAVKIEKMVDDKDTILNYYLNTIPMGPSTYGVQAASYAYFSKDVEDLTLAESALLAAIPKSTSMYSPYKRYPMDSLDGIATEDIVGYIYVGSVKYACVYNEVAIERQRVVLSGMLETGKVTQEEYDEAIAQDMRKSINPGQTKLGDVSSNSFTDYVMESVVDDLVEKNEMTEDEAYSYLYKGGLTITSTIDLEMQKTVENVFENFGTLLMGKEPTEGEPIGQNWKYFRWIGSSGYGCLDADMNCLNNSGYPLYFKKENILNDDGNLYFSPEEYEVDEEGNLIISSKKLGLHTTIIDVIDCYTINDSNELVVHNIGGLNIGDSYEILDSYAGIGDVKIFKDFLQTYPDFYSVDSEGIMTISKEYFYYTESGIVEPQSAVVILDYRTGQIKALIGGRKVEGSKTFNRAVDATRQPGSTIKPISVYMPAFELGDGPATIIDDVPIYNDAGQRWPKNWMEDYYSYDYKYHGLTTMRYALEQSLNVCSVKTLEKIGIEASMNALAKFGIIDLENPENDSFVSNTENSAYNDMNPSALALGGLTNGVSPLKMAAAYGTIANKGNYVEPICYTKVVDSNGNVILENEAEPVNAFSEESAFLIGDILRTTVTSGLSYTARIRDNDIDMAAKTGTTQDNGDLWCVGFSPYYACSVWVGNDNNSFKMGVGSTGTSRIMGEIMTEIHSDLAPAAFEVPDTIISVKVCEDSGMLPNEYCSEDPRGSRVHYEYFVKGTEPTEVCTTHVVEQVCGETFKLPSDYCPDQALIDRVFITRDVLYNPLENPYDKTGNMQAVIDARLIYEQVENDFNSGMDFASLQAKYDASTIMELNLVEATDEMMDEYNKTISYYGNVTYNHSTGNSPDTIIDETTEDDSDILDDNDTDNSDLTNNSDSDIENTDDDSTENADEGVDSNNTDENTHNNNEGADDSNNSEENQPEVKYKYYFEELNIISVNGIATENLMYDYLECEDYQYQVPTSVCDFHRRAPIKVVDTGNSPDDEMQTENDETQTENDETQTEETE